MKKLLVGFLMLGSLSSFASVSDRINTADSDELLIKVNGRVLEVKTYRGTNRILTIDVDNLTVKRQILPGLKKFYNDLQGGYGNITNSKCGPGYGVFKEGTMFYVPKESCIKFADETLGIIENIVNDFNDTTSDELICAAKQALSLLVEFRNRVASIPSRRSGHREGRSLELIRPSSEWL